MGEVDRFTTLRIGVVDVTAGEQLFQFDVRVLRASDGSYRYLGLGATLSDPFPSLEAAVAGAEASMTDAPDASAVVRWREDLSPVGPDERPCPVCTAPAPTSARYPNRLCPACIREATDAQGRPLTFANVGVSGGFRATYDDDGAPYDDHECFVRGVRCRADEAKFGGIVVQPTPP